MLAYLFNVLTAHSFSNSSIFTVVGSLMSNYILRGGERGTFNKSEDIIMIKENRERITL